MQKQVATAQEAARTKVAPVVADMVSDAARATGDKLRASKTVAADAIEHVRNNDTDAASEAPSASASADGEAEANGHREAWSAATRPTTTD